MTNKGKRVKIGGQCNVSIVYQGLDSEEGNSNQYKRGPEKMRDAQ